MQHFVEFLQCVCHAVRHSLNFEERGATAPSRRTPHFLIEMSQWADLLGYGILFSECFEFVFFFILDDKLIEKLISYRFNLHRRLRVPAKLIAYQRRMPQSP